MSEKAKSARQTFCVYNQANECFLSLDATLGEPRLARLWRWLRSARRADEGSWIRPQELRPSFGFSSVRDLVYLDGQHRVVHIAESFPAFRPVPLRSKACSFLALPPRTIASSHTRPGHQLLICAAGEMHSRLRRLRQCDERPVSNPVSIATLACFAEGGKLAVHSVRELSDRGLFLVTDHRWPIGAEVRMSLQPSGPAHQPPVTVPMRVTQWAADGLGLEFAGPANQPGASPALRVC